MLVQDAFETSSEMHSLMTFYAQQQHWVATQLAEQSLESQEEPTSPAASTSSTIITSSDTRSPSPSSSASSFSSVPKVRVVLGQASNRRTHIGQRLPNNHSKWSSRVFPSSHPLRRLKKARSRSHSGPRVILWTRTRRLSPRPSRKSSSPQSQRSTSQTPPVTKTTATTRSPSPEAVDLLVQYRAMIGDRMESCRRLQMMVDDSIHVGCQW